MRRPPLGFLVHFSSSWIPSMVTCRKQKAVEKPRTEGTSEY
jgi:hypothetical protein